MRRHLAHLLLLLSVLLLPGTVLAQVGEYRSDLAIGVNGGYVLNKVGFTPAIRQSMHGGATLGATIRYNCEKYFAMVCGIQAEVNLLQMGWTENILTSEDTYQRTINYIQVPFLARLAYGRERQGFQGYLVLGPEFSFCIGESVSKSGPWDEHSLWLRPGHVVEQYDLPVQNKLEYGITAGLGVEFSSRRAGHFQLEGRYHYGLSNIFHDSKKDPFGKSNNGAIVIKVAWLYDVIRTKNSKIK